MARVKRGNVARKRRNKILRLARGFQGSNGSLFRTANQRVMKALCNAYRDRRRRKRDFRRLWIARINAAARINGLSYSRLIGGLKKADVRLNRKMLAQLAMSDPNSFASVVGSAKSQIQYLAKTAKNTDLQKGGLFLSLIGEAKFLLELTATSRWR